MSTPAEVGSREQIISAFPPWMRRRNIMVQELKGRDGIADAAVAIDHELGRLIAFWSPVMITRVGIRSRACPRS